MPPLPKSKRVLEDFFGELERQFSAAQEPPKLPESLLLLHQQFARQSPQPDRLLLVKAATSPLLEAALPLMKVLAAIVATRDRPEMSDPEERLPMLVDEVNSFQSICQDANIRYEYTLGASYILCTALDEAIGDALAGRRVKKTEVDPWSTQSLAARFHGDSRGGIKVFTLLGGLISRPPIHIDLLELLLVVLRLGFEGVYRHAQNGPRERENIVHRVHALVHECRKAGSMSQFDHWCSLERSIELGLFGNWPQGPSFPMATSKHHSGASKK